MLNPILRREGRTSLRNLKIYVFIMIYAVIMTGIAVLFVGINASTGYRGFDPESSIILYVCLCAFQMAMIMCVTPALAAGSISGERERQTLDILLVTKMKPMAIIQGKMLSSISILLLIIFASLPPFAIVFYFGGVSFITFIKMVIFMLVTACMVGSISILFSTIMKKSVIATVIVYMVIFTMVIGTLIAVLFYIAMLYNEYYRLGLSSPKEMSIISRFIINGILSLNSGVGFFSLVDSQFGYSSVNDVFVFGSNDVVSSYIWIYNIIINIGITIGSLVLAAKLINPLNKK